MHAIFTSFSDSNLWLNVLASKGCIHSHFWFTRSLGTIHTRAHDFCFCDDIFAYPLFTIDTPSFFLHLKCKIDIKNCVDTANRIWSAYKIRKAKCCCCVFVKLKQYVAFSHCLVFIFHLLRLRWATIHFLTHC